MFNLFKDKFSVMELDKETKDENLLRLESSIKSLVKESFSSKLKVYVFDSGSCNGCELELQLLFSPLYDLASLGIEVVYESREADILLITGLMTENMYFDFEKVYISLKNPKRIILVGDCPLLYTKFQDNFALKTNADKFYATAHYIAGCPPEPMVLLEGLESYLKKD